jgi:hypothetical protein
MVEEIIAKVRLDNGQLQADVQSAKKIVDSGINEIEKNPIKLGADFSKIDAELKKIGNNAPALKSMLENLKIQLASATDKKTFDELSTSIRLTESALVKLTGETVKLDAVTQKYTDRLNVVNTKIKEWQKAGLDNTAGFSKLLREQELLTKKLGDTTTTSFAKSEERVVSLKTQMRQAQQEVAELSIKFGATSVQAIEAAKRASELKDAIGDARDLTDAFNPDAKFAALSGSIQGVVGGFTAVQGAIGAFGVKSEEVEQALLKVNSAMALSQGLQSVGQSVDSFKQLGAVIRSSTTFQFLYNAATSTATAVQSAFGVATAATTTGFKLLRGAIISTGIGALVVGLGMVIANFDAISEWISKSPLGAFANQVGNIVQKFTDFIGITSQAERQLASLDKSTKLKNQGIERQIKLLTAQGGKENEIAKLQKDLTQNEINLLNKKVDKKGLLYGEDAKNYRDLQNELSVIDAAESKRQNEEAEKQSEKARQKREEDNKKRIEAEKKAAKDLQEFTIQQFQKESKIKQDAFDATLSQQDLEKREVQDKYFELIETAKQYGLDTTALEAKRVADLKAIDDKYKKEEKDANDKKLEDKYVSEIQSAENFSKQQSLILKTRLANGEITEEQYNEKIKDLELTTLQSKISIASKWSGTVKKAEQDITTFTNEEADKRLNKQIENNKRNEELLKKQFNEIFEFANNGILLQIGLNPQDVNRVKGSIENLQTTLNKDNVTAEEKAAAYAEAAGAVAGTVSNALFAADTQRRQEELAALQAQQEEELRLAGDNEQKKDLIRQKYALKEKDIKRKQAEADKKKAMLDIVINTAVAVVKAFATTGPIAGPVFAAIVGALGLAQLALVAAQPIPKFEKGGAIPSSDIQGMISGKPHAAGGVLIEAEGNEFITRRSQAMKGDNLGLLEAINMSDSERDAYINRHYVMPALQAKESEAAKSYRSSIIEAENNLIARVSSHTLKSIHREQKNTTDAVKKLSNNKDFSW